MRTYSTLLCKILLILCLPLTLWSQCDPLTSAGEITGNESQCNSYNPSPITSLSLPVGGSGTIEYVWLATTNPAIPAGLINLDASILAQIMLPNTDAPTYDPGNIAQTTWYRRCARRAGCTIYNGESNWIKKEVGVCPADCFAKRIASNTIDNCSNLSTNLNPKPAYGVYINDGSSQVLYKMGNDVLFSEYTNGNAQLKGSVVNASGNNIGTFEVTFSGRTGVAGAENPKTTPCLVVETIDWYYYTSFYGNLTINGISYNLVNDGADFQVGTGANTQENLLGASGWWKSGSIAGDFNFNLGADQCVTCQNVNNPGVITGTESECNSYNPSRILNTTLPSGGAGTLEYVWLRTQDSLTVADINANFTVIAHNFAEYDPDEIITQTTWYRRCARRAGCNDYVGESEWIKKEVKTAPTVVISGLDKVCKYGEGSITLTAVPTPAVSATNNYQYLWNNAQTTASITANTTGKYSVTITANNCSATASKDVTVTECCNITDPGDICCSQSSCKIPFDPAIITESAPATGGEGSLIYLWLVSKDGVVFDEVPNSNSPTYDPPATSITLYYRRCVARQGCNPLNFESSNTIKIEVTAPPSVSITGNDKFCVYGAGNSIITANVTGGNAPYTYKWSNGATTKNITVTLSGDYSVTVTTTDGCTATATYKVEAQTCCNIIDPGDICCSQSSCKIPFDPAVITESAPATGGEGALIYLWLVSKDGIVFDEVPNSNSPTYDPPATSITLYYRRCVARQGCNPLNFESSNTIKIEVTAPPTASFSSVKNLICRGDNSGELTITATGLYPPFAYKWNNGKTEPTLTGLSAGNYSVTVTDMKGCSVVKNSAITQPATALVLTKSIVALKCNGDNNGSASIVATGGVAPYTYLWNTGANTTSISNLIAGQYAVSVKDANGCQKVANFNVTQPSKVWANASKQDVTCFGLSNGSITTAASGGTAPYTYKWSNLVTNPNISNLSSGTYTLTISDANSCTFYKDFLINQPKDIVASISKSDTKCFGSADGTAKIVANGGNGGFTYLWSNGNTTQQMLSLAKGTYTVTVCDAKQCKKSATTTISTPTDITLSLLPTTAGSCPRSATIKAVGGTAPYRYSKNGVNFNNINVFCNLPLGANTITVRDANNCTKSLNINISAYGAVTRSLELNFNAEKEGLIANLEWITEAEFDDVAYIIERSVGDNQHFSILKKELPRGSSAEARIYRTQDEMPADGMNYYRLRQVFKDGSEKITDEKAVLFPTFEKQMLLYPNPTSSVLNIGLKTIQAQEGNFYLYDGQGRLINSWKENPLKSWQQIDVNQLQSGIYKLVLMTDKNEFLSETFVFERF